jgi:hypothetical protein
MPLTSGHQSSPALGMIGAQMLRLLCLIFRQALCLVLP